MFRFHKTQCLKSNSIHILAQFNTLTCHISQIQKVCKDTKVLSRINIWQKGRQYNGLKKENKNTKDWTKIILENTGGELRCSGGVSRSCSTSRTSHSTLVKNPDISSNEERMGLRLIKDHFLSQRLNLWEIQWLLNTIK